MHTILYHFRTHASRQKDFVDAWRDMTQLIYQNEGSLGSRLHKVDDTNYIAYAQWPDAETFDKAGNNLPPEADGVRRRMRESCEKIEILYRMDVVEDLLKDGTF